MSHSLGYTRKTIHLKEPVVLIEALLVDCAERKIQGEAAPASALAHMHPADGDSRVIDFSEARQRRRWRDADRFREKHAET